MKDEARDRALEAWHKRSAVLSALALLVGTSRYPTVDFVTVIGYLTFSSIWGYVIRIGIDGSSFFHRSSTKRNAMRQRSILIEMVIDDVK
ncbi:MAG: hypothetical protein HKN87_18515 [Saprospiraceae bacterium]|nr:hypothetical protein [Saprospiraceae bacterium]